MKLLLIIPLLAACAGGMANAPRTADLTDKEAQGARLFDQYCESCHATEGDTVVVGPSLADVGEQAEGRVEGMAAEAYLLQSINKPGAYVVEGFKDQMPPSLADSLSPDQKEALIAYMMTLR